MKKLLISTAMAATFGVLSPVTQAATTTASFNVSVTLTSQCTVTSAGAQKVDFGTYTAFQAGAQASTTSAVFSLNCTRNFGAPSVTATPYDTVAGTSTAAGVGVVQGLQYALNAPVLGAKVAGAAATSASIGSADTYSVTVSGTMPAGQAGTCAAASCGPTNDPRILTISF